MNYTKLITEVNALYEEGKFIHAKKLILKNYNKKFILFILTDYMITLEDEFLRNFYFNSIFENFKYSNDYGFLKQIYSNGYENSNKYAAEETLLTSSYLYSINYFNVIIRRYKNNIKFAIDHDKIGIVNALILDEDFYNTEKMISEIGMENFIDKLIIYADKTNLNLILRQHLENLVIKWVDRAEEFNSGYYIDEEILDYYDLSIQKQKVLK